MDSGSGTAPNPSRKRKARELEDEDDTLAVAPPKHLHASITWDVQAKDMSHHMFCTKFVAIMDTAIESQKWNVDIQKKCMELMGSLRLSDFSSKAISSHKLAKEFLENPSFIIIMMLKLLYPLEKMKRCNFLLSAVAREYPGWDYSTESYPPSKYPASQPAERELETVKASIEGMDKLVKEIHSTTKDTNNKLQDVAATKHVGPTERNIKKWINDAIGELGLQTTTDFEKDIRDSLAVIKQGEYSNMIRLMNLDGKVELLIQEMKK
uniref:Uncharacterized protein n=1 Tax=Bionectria ochroleuca TaxID=29856 RepID=A0A8H7NP58_BIOOC